jgi:hypothetical protein
MHEFRKSFVDPDRGMSIKGRGEQSKILDSMVPPTENKPLPTGVRKINISKHLSTGKNDRKISMLADDQLLSMIDWSDPANILITVDELAELVRTAEKEITRLVIIDKPAADRLIDEFNLRNRPIRPGALRKYIDYIAAGKWVYTPAPMAFLNDQRIGDAQHRLLAISITGARMLFRVTIGTPVSAMQGMDDNAARSQSDRSLVRNDSELLDDHPKVKTIQALCRCLAGLYDGSMPQNFPLYKRDRALLAHRDGIQEVLALPATGYYKTAHVLAPIAYAMRANKETVLAFAKRFLSGAGMRDEGDPALSVRKWYERNRLELGRDNRRLEFMQRVITAIYSELYGNSRVRSSISQEAIDHFHDLNAPAVAASER